MDTVLTEIQKITLKDILTTAGLKQRQVEDIFLLLSFKPERVQLAFYYRACGETYDDVGKLIGQSPRMVFYYISESCSEINDYFRYNIM